MFHFDILKEYWKYIAKKVLNKSLVSTVKKQALVFQKVSITFGVCYLE